MNDLPDFQPAPLGLAPITPETAQRPARKAKDKPPKKERKPRTLKDKLAAIEAADAGEASVVKKPRKKRKAKQRPTESISKMALVIELDKIAGRLAELSGCERGDAFKAISKVFR